MADVTESTVLSAIATANSKLSSLPVKDGQLIFVQDKSTIALDFGGKRVLYKQIEEIQTEEIRASMLAPVTGRYYFVIDTGTFWTYRNGWQQITSTPTELKEYADSVSSSVLVDAKAYADELSKHITGSVDDDGTVVLMLNDKLWSAE